MADNITCTLCGGTDFYVDAGHYYCNECQTQSQEIQEHVFEVPEETTAQRRTSSKKVRTAKKAEDSLTSWECYNYIIRGLVDELLELGADAKLKETVKIVWFKYLSKLEVIGNKPNAPPKLPAFNSEKDAGIIYGRQRTKRKRSRTPSPSSSSEPTTMDSSTLRKEKAKQRRSLILAQYDEFSNTLQSEEISLHNQSLVSLKSGSDTSSKEREKYLQYNRGARKELLKVMSKNHLKAHCRDIDSVLDCHKKLSYRSASWKYTHGPEILSRNRIYAILYLGLLIIKDDIQLGDMIRFVREGSLSYYEVSHFFPEELSEKNLNIKNWNYGNSMLSHSGIRVMAADIAKWIEITSYIPRQNLVKLCERYCNEMNLPHEVMGYTLNLMSKSLPKLDFTMQSRVIPNYEGRVMSMIMFILKFMFGLDGVTEDKFSAHAEYINSNLTNQRMFVWKEWIHFTRYRKLILMQHHFPTKYLYDSENVQNSDLFVGFMTEFNSRHEKEEKLTRQAEVLKRLLEKLKDRQTQAQSQEHLHFAPSLTPFRDYIAVLVNSEVPQEKNYLIEVLTANFKDDSLDFLTKPLGYLEEINKTAKVGIKHRGANDNIRLIKINNIKVTRENWRKHAKKEVFVKLCDNVKSKNTSSRLNHIKLKDNVTVLDSKAILHSFALENKPSYRRSMKKLLKSHNSRKRRSNPNSESFVIASQLSMTQSQFSQAGEASTSQAKNESLPFANCSFNSQEHQDRRDYVHYNPHERFWLNTFEVHEVSTEEFTEFSKTLPESFQLILNECARIIEYSPKELFQEYTDVEIYLCYVAQFSYTDKFRGNVYESNLKRFITRAKKNW